MNTPHIPRFANRREFLLRAGGGFGALALAALSAEETARATQPVVSNPLAVRPPHHRPRAKSVIFLFMFGGPVGDWTLFDPKPTLERWHGRPMDHIDPADHLHNTPPVVMQSPFRFSRHGQSGLEISECFPELARCADDLCVIRSMHAENNNHRPAIFQLNTGSVLAGRPSMGAWVSYGLGSENENLPAFVVLLDRLGAPFGGALNWSSGFMPATYQGTTLRTIGEPIADLSPPAGLRPEQQRARLDLLAALNERHRQANPAESGLAARIASYELAYRMQSHAPEAVDLNREPAPIRQLYGLDNPVTEPFGRQCLLARRLVERGVRFVQLYSGGGNANGTTGWDAHANLRENHTVMCNRVDRPIAGLLTDLKSRGLLDETLVVWGGEFGRLPVVHGTKAATTTPRLYHVAGRRRRASGGTDLRRDRRVRATASPRTPCPCPDLHATMLHLLGLDHRRLTFLHNGREERLTENGGRVAEAILA
jgi:hypothetical protein